jgi:TPR repeat protein
MVESVSLNLCHHLTQ